MKSRPIFIKTALYILSACLISIFFLTAFRTHETSAPASDVIPLPIIMYHGVFNDPSRSGDYVVTPRLLEDDLTYLKNRGYSTVTMAELINYVHTGSPLPEKPVMITFDDGMYSTWYYATPIFKKLGMTGVISIVGSYTDEYTASGDVNLNYSYLRWEDLKQVLEDGIFELQNHSYSFHSYDSKRRGSTIADGETFEEYAQLFTEDTMKLQNAFSVNLGYVPNTYTYPYGAMTTGTADLLREMGFSASLSCNAGVNAITANPRCLFGLKRNNRPAHISTERFFSSLGI